MVLSTTNEVIGVEYIFMLDKERIISPFIAARSDERAGVRAQR